MREATITRKTAETDVRLRLVLEGGGKGDINTGVGFLDHMLTLFARHGRFDLDARCDGDVRVDAHHTTEDLGICLGLAFREALGDKAGITRYGDCTLPMDESLVLTAVDISGRGLLVWDLPVPAQKVGDFDTELAEEFWAAFARSAEMTLHVRLLTGRNSHHILEGAFKSAGRSLRQAVAMDPAWAGEVPSTKGSL